MEAIGKIITVGLCPCWDMVCRMGSIEWGGHEVVDWCDNQPAGKALNISRALAWRGQKNIAAGLWGEGDFEQMQRAMKLFGKTIEVRMTVVEGNTRQNVSVIDLSKKREMHLRNKCGLASKKAIEKLKADLAKIVSGKSVCVFAGALPGGRLLTDVVSVIDCCRERGGKVVLDTSGGALKRIVNKGKLWIVKPNVSELRELIGRKVPDRAGSLVKAGRQLLNKAEIILISRGDKGAIAVTKEEGWQGGAVGSGETLYTVGCGDYMLAGFLRGLKEKGDLAFALGDAVRLGTAKAMGLTDKKWVRINKQIKVKVKKII